MDCFVGIGHSGGRAQQISKLKLSIGPQSVLSKSRIHKDPGPSHMRDMKEMRANGRRARHEWQRACVQRLRVLDLTLHAPFWLKPVAQDARGEPWPTADG